MKAHNALRESWLTRAVGMFRTHFDKCGYVIPDNVRVSCGLPSSGAFGRTKRTLGEAWSSIATRDRVHEIYISPTMDDPTKVLAVLAHELVHVTVGLDAGHRGAFITCGRAIGLAGPWTECNAQDSLLDLIKAMREKLGDYPHGSLEKMTNNKKKQGTRLIKAGCPEHEGGCGYTIRAAMQWLLIAPPRCPNDECERCGEYMEVDWPDANEPPDARSRTGERAPPANKGERAGKPHYNKKGGEAIAADPPAGADPFLDEAGKL